MPQCPSECGWYALNMAMQGIPSYTCIDLATNRYYTCTPGALDTVTHYQQDGNEYYTTTAPNWDCVPQSDNTIGDYYVAIEDSEPCPQEQLPPPPEIDNDGGHEQVRCCAYSSLFSRIFQ